MTQIFAKVLNMSLTASFVIFLVLAARFILRKSPKVFSYALWAVVLFRLLCPVSIPSPVSLLGLLDAPVAQTEGFTTSVAYIPYEVVEEAGVPPEQFPALSQDAPAQAPVRPAKSPLQPTKHPLSAAQILTYIWLAGVALMGLAGVGSCVRFRRHLTGAMQVQGNLYLVDHIDSAFVAGLIRPKIYLPSDIPLNRMGYIIAHEQQHIRRLDHVTKHLSFAALCIHWFNPLVWAAFILAGKDLEMSCDEAVIRQLGEDIRADYSASLLALATGRRIIAGTPLAFGEGDTKERIQNMARWKQPKKWVNILSFMLCFGILAACAANPEQPVVISKNDGSLDIQNIQAATAPAQDAPASQTLEYSDHFQSTDQSVDITFSLNQELPAGSFPMVEVEPRYLTGADAKRIAETVFGKDAEFYEERPTISDKEILSKAELQQKQEKWQTWLDLDYMTELYGDRETAQSKIDIVKIFIDQYAQRYSAAPEADQRQPCRWSFRTSSAYFYDEESLATADTSEDWQAIEAEVISGSIPYFLSIGVRNQPEFQLNSIHASIGSAIPGPSTIEHDEWIAKLCRTEKPTQGQMTAVRGKAEHYLAQLGLGDWTVDQCYVQTLTYHGTPEHSVFVTAVPVLEGAAAIRQPDINTPKSKEAYASHYYMTSATFQFAPGGELLGMNIQSTLQLTQVIQSSVAVLSMEDLLAQAKTQLSLTDASSYFLSQPMLEDYEDIYDEELICALSISQANYGLVRIKAPDTDDHYYYVPALMLLGDCEYRGKDTGKVYERYSDFVSSPYYFLCINAVNGSNIPLGQ